MRVLILLLLLAISQQTLAVNDTTAKKNYSFFLALAYFNKTDGGLFYTEHNYRAKNGTYEEDLKKDMGAISFGLKYKRWFQKLEFGLRTAVHNNSGLGRVDKLKTVYTSYEAWYSFLERARFPIKPLFAINLAFAYKEFLYVERWDYGSGNTGSHSFRDFSSTFFLQVPLGALYSRGKILISCAYHFPIVGWIMGSFNEEIRTPPAYNPGVEKFNETYSGNSFDEQFQLQRNVINFRVGYNF